jgi:hypothetical protein
MTADKAGDVAEVAVEVGAVAAAAAVVEAQTVQALMTADRAEVEAVEEVVVEAQADSWRHPARPVCPVFQAVSKAVSEFASK